MSMFNIYKLPLEIFIGYSGENIFRSFAFDVSPWKETYPQGSVSISFRRPDQDIGYPVVVNSKDNPVVWTVTEADVSSPGEGEIVLRLQENDIVGKTYSIRTTSSPSPDFTGDPPEPFPDWLKDILEVEESVSEDVREVANNTQLVLTNTQTVIEKTAEALQSAANALVSETNAEDSNQSALTAMKTATQAMTDLLAMLGSDIATLTDGKLTPSQIPPLSINDVFEVDSIAEMLTLVAQRGDVALVMLDDNIHDSYMLAVDDPTQLENWKKLGVSYVANAGHAITADNAENANMINNHRVVVMTQAQYDVAVKDPDTVYLVGVE